MKCKCNCGLDDGKGNCLGCNEGGSMEKFQHELAELINKYSIENECDMPDGLLAEMICNFIKGVGKSIKKNLDWHGCDSVCHPKPKRKRKLW